MGNINLSSLKIPVTYTHDSIITRRKEIKTQTFLVIKSVLSKQLSKIYPFIYSINHVLGKQYPEVKYKKSMEWTNGHSKLLH